MPTGTRPPIPPSYARVALSGTTFGHKWANVFYLHLTGSGITSADLNTLAHSIATAWGANFAGAVPSSVILANVTIVYVPSVGNEITGSYSASTPGTNSASAIDDASAAYVINWSINAYYRGGKPRWYLPGVPTIHVTNGSDVDPATASSLASIAVAFLTAVNALTTTNITAVAMGTMSFATGNAWRTTPLFRPFLNSTVALKLGSQRRRIRS